MLFLQNKLELHKCNDFDTEGVVCFSFIDFLQYEL